MSDNSGILLIGLNGSNPLAFLAALGTLRTLTLARPDETVKMNWEQYEGAWRPRVWCSLANNGKAIIKTLNEHLAKASNRVSFAIGDNLNLPAGEFRSHLLKSIENVELLTSPAARIDTDFLAAFGSEAVVDENGLMTDTALRTMSGAGHQHFLKVFRELVAKTDADHLRRALLLPWDYADEGRGMNLRWDPADDRRYALRWDDPSGDPSKTMRGANRLAMEALPSLPTMPIDRGLATTAFEGKSFFWPIWTSKLSLDVTRSLLNYVIELKANAAFTPSVGVGALFTSTRINPTSKFRSFTPGKPAGTVALD